jgi:hypothetical protein
LHEGKRSKRSPDAGHPRASDYEISRVGLHWEDLDEDISIAGLLADRSDITRQSERAV